MVGANEENVAGADLLDSRHVLDRLGDGVGEVVGVVIDAQFTVDAQGDMQLLRVRDFVLGHYAGTERTEGGVRLVFRDGQRVGHPTTATSRHSRRDVHTRRVAEDVVHGLRRRNVLAALAEDQHEFRLMVKDVGVYVREDHGAARAQNAVGALGETPHW